MKPTKKQRAQWAQTVAAYRQRSRMWVMEQLPTMSEAEWKEYTAWVAAFGNQTRGRRVRRQLNAAKDANVTAAVTKTMKLKLAAHYGASKHTMRKIIIRGSSLALKGGPV